MGLNMQATGYKVWSRQALCLFSGTVSFAELADSSENLDVVCSGLRTLLAQDVCADVFAVSFVCHAVVPFCPVLSQCILPCTLTCPG